MPLTISLQYHVRHNELRGKPGGAVFQFQYFTTTKNLNENEEKSSFTVHDFFLKKKSFTFGFVPERSTLG